MSRNTQKRRDQKIRALRRRGLSDKQIEVRMREWDLAEKRIKAREAGEVFPNQYGTQ